MKYDDEIDAELRRYRELNNNASGIDSPLPRAMIEFLFARLTERVAELDNELETERMRIAACGVAAMQNTENSAKDRIRDDSPYYSASYADVCSAVDREMKLRAENERLRGEVFNAVKALVDKWPNIEHDDDKMIHAMDAIKACENIPHPSAIPAMVEAIRNGDMDAARKALEKAGVRR